MTINLAILANVVIFSALGMGLLGLGFLFIELVTPRTNLWKQLVEEHNTALAIFLGSLIIGMSLIIAAVLNG